MVDWQIQDRIVVGTRNGFWLIMRMKGCMWGQMLRKLSFGRERYLGCEDLGKADDSGRNS
jgi:hypothetical protein